MEYRASLRYARITPRKLRLVADLVRGKNAQDALSLLSFSPKRGAYLLAKLLKSALANAEQRPEVDIDQLQISRLVVGAGPIVKRWRSAPQGRAVPIKKRTSHATIVLTEKPSTTEPESKTPVRARQSTSPSEGGDRSETSPKSPTVTPKEKRLDASSEPPTATSKDPNVQRGLGSSTAKGKK